MEAENKRPRGGTGNGINFHVYLVTSYTVQHLAKPVKVLFNEKDPSVMMTRQQPFF